MIKQKWYWIVLEVSVIAILTICYVTEKKGRVKPEHDVKPRRITTITKWLLERPK